MSYFAGLDVSLEETTVCIVDDAGRIVREARVASEPDDLVTFFKSLGLAMERIGLAGCGKTPGQTGFDLTLCCLGAI